MLCGLPVDAAFAVVVVGADKLAGVTPQGADSKVVEVVGDDGGGDELAEGDHLVVAVVQVTE